ncbi:uncharacterized protein scaf1 isoform 1-T2 [Spinachia spinachia]
MDLTSASGFKQRPAALSPASRVGEATRSHPPCSPSFCPSSPSSDPSSPVSTSSSVGGNSSVYQNHVKVRTRGSEVARVSSTSASLATQSLFTLASNTSPSELFPHSSVQLRLDCDQVGPKREMYDPFHPTEGVKEVGGEGEKYDPFDPTGSPVSDSDDADDSRRGIVRGVKRNAASDEEEKDEDPPDSTDALSDQNSPCRSTLRRRVECSSAKAGEPRFADSDHSEIEEGEIVGLADRDGGNHRPPGDIPSVHSPSVSFFGSKPERILRVLDGDGFVSVRTESNWEVDMEPEDEPVVGVEDLRRKLVSRRKERYLSFPASSPLSPQPPPPSHPPASAPSSPLTPQIEKVTKNRCKSSKSSKDSDRQKSKDRKAGEKEEKRKKSRKEKEGAKERSKEKERGHKTVKEVKGRRSSRSSSRKRKKRQHSSPEASRSCNSTGRVRQTRPPFSSLSEERPKAKEREKDRSRDRGREKDRDRDREQSRTSSHRRDERDRDSSSRKDEMEKKERQHSSSRERGISKRSKRSRETREGNRDRQRDRERRRDGRPVVPPSIQDLNGSDLFAIKRTITVTTTTTTTTVPGSPRLGPPSPCRPSQDSDMPQKRKKKRKWHSAGEMDDLGSCHSQSQSISPPRYHGYESDRYSDKLEIDVLSLDGEALDSDYPSLEDTPPAALPPEPPAPGPKPKAVPKTGRRHLKKKSHALKKIDQASSKGKCLSSQTVTSGSATASLGLPSAKRARKLGKDKDRDKGSRKDLGHSGKYKRESSGSRKGKLQSKVSVLVREGVSSTTGTSLGSAKLGMDLLGPGGAVGGAGSSVVGGSIAVVFCRDNESRSPFLKPCSEPLSLSNRSKDLASMGKRSSLAAPPSSLTSPAGLKPKKTKPSSITSTSSSASSPSSSLATKRRRRLAKKTREKSGAVGQAGGEDDQTKAQSEGWGGASLEVQSALADRRKSVSPHTSQAGPALCSSSSSSSSTSVLPPSSSPPHTPPPSILPLCDTRESSPDSQTVDSSCKTPDPSFLAEDCPTQTSPTLLPSSPSSLSTPQGAVLSIALSTATAKPPPPDDATKSLPSPPCSSSSGSCGFTSISLPPSSSDPSSSSSVSSSSASKPPPHPPPPLAAPGLPWSLQTGVDCTTGGVLALTALLFKMEEANIASRAKAQEFIQATSQILSQANQSQSQQLAPPSSASQIPPPPSLPPPSGRSPAQFILHNSLPLVGCTKTPPSVLHHLLGGGCAQTPPSIMPIELSGVTGSCGDTGWENESKDPDKYLKKLHTQERAVEEVKLAIKPYYQRKDINKDDYKDILRKAVHKICHSRTGEINPVKVSNLVKLYVQRYKYFRKHGRKMDEEDREDRELHSSA